MNYTIYDYLGLFFFYAFLGWLLETSVAAIRKKHMVNRGFLNGALPSMESQLSLWHVICMNCSQSTVFLFLGCMIIATAVEWLAGHALERIGHGKWWDYSNKKWNMDGYICLQYSVLWGILGLLAMKIGNRLCFTVLHSIPAGFLHITSWILFGILIVDAVGSYAVLHHITKKCRGSALWTIRSTPSPDAFLSVFTAIWSVVWNVPIRPYSQFRRKRENRNRRICRRMQLLQNRSSLHHRRIFGRYYRNHILSHHRRCLDEPQ